MQNIIVPSFDFSVQKLYKVTASFINKGYNDNINI